jgi:hypothetical protein
MLYFSWYYFHVIIFMLQLFVMIFHVIIFHMTVVHVIVYMLYVYMLYFRVIMYMTWLSCCHFCYYFAIIFPENVTHSRAYVDLEMYNIFFLTQNTYFPTNLLKITTPPPRPLQWTEVRNNDDYYDIVKVEIMNIAYHVTNINTNISGVLFWWLSSLCSLI